MTEDDSELRAEKDDAQTNKGDEHHRQSLWQRFRKLTIGNQITSISNIVIAVTTFVYMVVSFLTLLTISNSSVSSSRQVDKLIDAANIQARAATKNAEAAAQFAASADGINTKTGEAVANFNRMAKASEASIKATQEVMRLDQRAWISGVVRHEPTGFVIRFTNTGKTPAIKVSPPHYVSAAYRDFPIPIEELRHSPSIPPPPQNLPAEIRERIQKEIEAVEKELSKHEGYVLAPESWYDFSFPVTFGPPPTITPEQMIAAARKRNFIQGYLTYIDVFKQMHETWFCYFQSPQGGDVQMCDSENGMN